jgi:RNA polymerase sigma-70 factor (ECF subfamily)
MALERAAVVPASLPGAPSAETRSAASTGALDAAMERYAEGDDAAFAEVFRELAPRMRAFLQRLSGRREIADDLTQETFLRIHRARGTFAKGRAVLPWAYAIARNCYLDHYRARSRLRVSCDSEMVHEVATGRETDAEDEVSARRSAERVEQTLAKMTPARREAFVLLRYEGLSVEAAAQVLGVSEGAVKVRAFHAYELLRQALELDR